MERIERGRGEERREDKQGNEEVLSYYVREGRLINQMDAER